MATNLLHSRWAPKVRSDSHLSVVYGYKKGGVVTRTNLLTWHGGAIPDDEVWNKIEGDKGGETLKMSLLVTNVADVNSPKEHLRFRLL